MAKSAAKPECKSQSHNQPLRFLADPAPVSQGGWGVEPRRAGIAVPGLLRAGPIEREDRVQHGRLDHGNAGPGAPGMANSGVECLAHHAGLRVVEAQQVAEFMAIGGHRALASLEQGDEIMQRVVR